MSITDRIAQALALRWLRGKVDAWRKDDGTMGKISRLADGWKCLFVVLGVIASSTYALVTGHDVSGLLVAGLQAVGWADADLIERAKVLATVVAPLLLGLWASWSRLSKAFQQFRAGARGAELLSTGGYVKQARADGKLGE